MSLSGFPLVADKDKGPSSAKGGDLITSPQYMKTKLSILPCALVAISLGSAAANAQTTVPKESVRELANLNTNNSYYYASPQANPNRDTKSVWGGANKIDVKGYGVMFDFCTEFYVEGAASSYSVASGLNRYSQTDATQISALFTNAAPLLIAANNLYVSRAGSDAYNPNFSAEWKKQTDIANALQTALWEITDEKTETFLSLTSTHGNFAVKDQNSTGNALAISWLKNVADGTWTSNPSSGIGFYHAQVDGKQDRLWVIPEPSSSMLVILSALIPLSIRRRK